MTELNSTQAIILGILHDGPAPGSKIEAEARKLDGHWNVTRSQVYRELPVLHEKGFATKLLEPSEEWKGVDPYVITRAGRVEYSAWFQIRELTSITRDPWILRERLIAYTGLTDEVRESFLLDALTAAQTALQAELSKDHPDKLLIDRHTTAVDWFAGSLS